MGQQAAEAEDSVLDVRAAARLANRSPETIRRWVWSGRLPARRQGNRLLVSRGDVVALMRTEGPALTLAEWAEEARRARAQAGPAPGRSAADLVLEDRRLRSGSDRARDRR